MQAPTIRIYLRRSKNDRGKQQFSLDVQRTGCTAFARDTFSDTPIVEYVDDGKSGDDFLDRAGLKRLIAEVNDGDIVIARDQSRLGRDALEVSLVIRELVQDSRCRVFYYVDRQEVRFSNAIEQATTYIQRTGHQMELESNRSRVTESLRSKVRSGRIAGGRCFGYKLVREDDRDGRGYTIAVVDDDQAAVVKRIYHDYLGGLGLKAIAHALNAERVPSPTVGKRGSGSWAPSGIRAMLLNSRYRGLYVHGRVKMVRRKGKRVRVKADPDEVITVDMPEWRIVDDDVWLAVQEKFAARKRGSSCGSTKAGTARKNRPGNACKYALSGIGRCAGCGGAICVVTTKTARGRIKAYACSRHHYRGNAVCPIKTRQSVEDVEKSLAKYLSEELLVPGILDEVLASIRDELSAELDESVDTAQLEAEIESAKTGIRKLIQLGALAGDDAMAEIATELKVRTERVKELEAELAAAQRGPMKAADLMQLVSTIEMAAHSRLRALRERITANPHDAREIYERIFVGGLTFSPVTKTKRPRKAWLIEGVASLSGSIFDGDPTGN